MTQSPEIRRILVLEDEPNIAAWLEAILREAFPRASIEWVDSLAALSSLVRKDPAERDVALIDLRLPDGTGLDALRELRPRWPGASLVVATVIDDDSSLFSALRLGADGYLLKDTPRQLLVLQLRAILQGQPPLSPVLAQRVLAHFRGEAAGGGEPSRPAEEPAREQPEKLPLSARETEVLTLLAKGMRVADIGSMLSISEHTAASHVKSIYRKLHIGSRAEAATVAMKAGLIR